MTRRHQLQITLILMIEQVICPSYHPVVRFELAVERRQSENKLFKTEKNKNRIYRFLLDVFFTY